MQTILANDQFAVTWPDPAMGHAPWVGDRMHFPGPTVQLAQRVVGLFQEQILSAPTVFANGYEFSLPPTIPDPPPDVVAGGLAVWHNDYSPRIRAFCERVRGTDFDAMTLAEAGAAMDRLAGDAIEALRLTMVVVKKFMEPTFVLLQFLEAELGADGPILSGTLLQGSRNATAASGAGLDALAGQAAASPALAKALKAREFTGLAGLPGGREFLAELDRFLNDFGWRAETWGAMHVPTWAENPAGVLDLVARYLADPENGPDALARRSSEQQAAALAEVESRLTGEKLATFREMVRATREHVAVSEDRARWQLSVVGVMRLPALALGRKLVAAGALDRPEDVFHLTWDEALRAAGEPGEWVRGAARSGRADFERWERLAPPPFLGAMPDVSQLPPEMLPMIRHFFGLGMPSINEGVVQGAGASRGTVTGRARVIRHLDESDKLEPGDVMVCVTTAPPWTALFAIAGAVVTDTGGVMSHSGICAREFAIPCVVGTQIGTNVIPDGAMVTVDGEAGTVAILA
jgi:pyruvate,water dikinase